MLTCIPETNEGKQTCTASTLLAESSCLKPNEPFLFKQRESWNFRATIAHLSYAISWVWHEEHTHPTHTVKETYAFPLWYSNKILEIKTLKQHPLSKFQHLSKTALRTDHYLSFIGTNGCLKKKKKSSLTLKNEKLSFDSLKLQQTALSALRAHAINPGSTQWSFIL